MANIVTGIVRFTGTKPVEMMPTKANEEDELKRKELELKREKKEEAARKREEYLKAKANEKKRCVHLFTLFVISAVVLIHYVVFLMQETRGSCEACLRKAYPTGQCNH